jgi:ribose transport system substrate-binding protein
VAFVSPGSLSLYWESCHAGALAAADNQAAAVRWESPDWTDAAASQRSILETLIAGRPHAILIAPADPVELTPLLQQASDAGIAIGLTKRAETPDETPYAVCVRTDDAEAGRLAARHLSAKITEGGGAAIVAAAGAQRGVLEDAFSTELGAMPKPVSVAELSLDFADEIAALGQADALLRAPAKIQGVFCAGTNEHCAGPRRAPHRRNGRSSAGPHLLSAALRDARSMPVAPGRLSSYPP